MGVALTMEDFHVMSYQAKCLISERYFKSANWENFADTNQIRSGQKSAQFWLAWLDLLIIIHKFLRKFQNFNLSSQLNTYINLKDLMPVTFSSPMAQMEVQHFLISKESPYFSICTIQNFNFKFFEVLEI